MAIGSDAVRGTGGGCHRDGCRCRLDGCAPCEQRLERGGERADVECVQGAAEALALRLDQVRLLEPLRQRAASAEDQRLDGRLGDFELLGDLAIREPLPFAQQDRATLLLRHAGERVLDPDQLVVLPARAWDDLLDHLEVARALDPAATPRRAATREADVLGDLEQPRRLGLGHDAAAERAERVHVRRLDGVLSLLARAELVQAVALELRGVTLVEAFGRCRLGGGAGALDEARRGLWTELRPNRIPLMWRDEETGVPPERLSQS